MLKSLLIVSALFLYSRINAGYLNNFTTLTESKRRGREVTEAKPFGDLDTVALPDSSKCGLPKETDRILGGEVTELGEFPWIAALEYKSKLTGENVGIKCGGSLINNRYVLTAALCILNPEFELIRVWLGDWNINTEQDCNNDGSATPECADPPQKLAIKKKIPHPYYSRLTSNNDIALLRLERDIEYSDYIRPICLPPSNSPVPDTGTKLTVVGWGVTENGTSSDVLLKVTVPLLENIQCRIKRIQNINSTLLCAGGERGKDSCQGDSGGPLMRGYQDHSTQQKRWYQEGLVSSGIGCGKIGYPALYTPVSRYTEWIITQIQED